MKRGIVIFILILTLVFASACSSVFRGKTADKAELPAVSDYSELVGLLADMGISRQMYYVGREMLETTADSVKSTEAGAANQANDSDYSGTNVQVEGVDEADIIKTDGRYIYYVNMNRIVIVEAYPAATMKVLKSIEFTETDFYPSEIYLNGKYLVVIGSKYYYYPMPMPEATEGSTDEAEGSGSGSSPGTAPDESDADKSEYGDDAYDSGYTSKMMPYYRGKDTVSVLIYDVEDPAAAKLVRTFETDGYYVSSRMIGTELYLVSNKYIYVYSEEPDEGQHRG